MDHIHTFLTTQGHGGPPRMCDQPNAGVTSETAQTWKTIHTPSTHSVIPTRRKWNDDDGGQMILRDLGSLKFPDICLTGEEKPRKTSPRKLVSTGDRTRARGVKARMLPLAPQRWTTFVFKFRNMDFSLINLKQSTIQSNAVGVCSHIYIQSLWISNLLFRWIWFTKKVSFRKFLL